MNKFDWRIKDEVWQKRQFLMSSFVRMKIDLRPHIYEFCDYLISQGYTAPLDSLSAVDIDIRKLYNEYAEHIGWEERI